PSVWKRRGEGKHSSVSCGWGGRAPSSAAPRVEPRVAPPAAPGEKGGGRKAGGGGPGGIITGRAPRGQAVPRPPGDPPPRGPPDVGADSPMTAIGGNAAVGQNAGRHR